MLFLYDGETSIYVCKFLVPLSMLLGSIQSESELEGYVKQTVVVVTLQEWTADSRRLSPIPEWKRLVSRTWTQPRTPVRRAT